LATLSKIVEVWEARALDCFFGAVILDRKTRAAAETPLLDVATVD